VWRRGGHSHDGGGDFAAASARNYSPERAAQLCCDAAGFRHFAMATNRSCSGQIKIRPSAATGYPAISRVD